MYVWTFFGHATILAITSLLVERVEIDYGILINPTLSGWVTLIINCSVPYPCDWPNNTKTLLSDRFTIPAPPEIG